MNTSIVDIVKFIEEVAIPVTSSKGFDTNQFHGILGELKTAIYLGEIDKTYTPAPPNTPDYDGISEQYGKVSSKYATISNKDSRIFLNNNLKGLSHKLLSRANHVRHFLLRSDTCRGRGRVRQSHSHAHVAHAATKFC